jgi:aldose 1-epimerase
MAGLQTGGRPVIFLSDEASEAADFALTRAAVAPGRGMMLLQAWGRLRGSAEVELIESPSLESAAALLDAGDADDFAGNLAFSFGGAILIPYANRIRGRPLAASREIETLVGGRRVRLPRNWGGRALGAEQYAMHGLLLDRTPDRLLQPTDNRIEAEFQLGGFEGRWPSRTVAMVAWTLDAGRLKLEVNVSNAGDEPLPVGVGWHPYFKLLSGDRRKARLQVPASHRLAVNDYDEVLPTGQKLALPWTPYDFSAPVGGALNYLYLDDCFVGIAPGPLIVAVTDPVAGYSVRLRTTAPPVRAVQVYAPPDRPVVVLEPQTNWADPFGQVWDGEPSPIPMLEPGRTLKYEVVTSVSPF